MEWPKTPNFRVEPQESASKQAASGGSVSLFLRLWSYGGPSEPPSSLALDQDPRIRELIRSVIGESHGVIAEWRPELLSSRFDDAFRALSAAKTLQFRFLTFRNTEPQQVVPSILIYGTKTDDLGKDDEALPEDMLLNFTSAQILIGESIYESVKDAPGFQFSPTPMREAGETFGPEAIYELLWTDESTYGHLRHASRANFKTLGRYQIQEALGRGAMGAVYKAFDPVIARTVALKTILIDGSAPDRAQMIERLKLEAKAAGGLDHPNIITIYDVGEENDSVYLSMQFVKGTTLAKLLADVGVPSLPTLISWAEQISAAVGFAHARGVIHRDLKPANLMVTEQGAIKVLDFGIAKIENASLTQTGLVMGTPSYMAPEQIAGKKVDHRADIFSLGAVFYELLTREKAFTGDVATILYKIVNEDPVAPSLINPAIPGGIDAVIRKALQKDPKDRFQTCEEMRKAFLEHAGRASLAGAAHVAVDKVAGNRSENPAPVPRFFEVEPAPRRIWPRLILGSALVLMGAASWAFYIRSRSGMFPPPVRSLEGKAQQALTSASGKMEQFRTPVPRDAVDQHAVTPARPQNPETADAPATVPQTPPASAASSSAPLPTLQPVAAPSPNDHPLSESAPVSGAPASSPSAEISQKPADLSQTVAPQAIDPSENNQPVADNATPHDSPNASVADDGKQTVPPATSKLPARQRAPEPTLTADGFSRQDIPDLLRQADSSTARGDYRLARYEYRLVLRLDRNNVQAREGLRRLAWQSR
jgi:serine/threonine protein kinase